MNVTSAQSGKLATGLSDILISDMEIANYELMVVASAGDGAEGFFKKLEGFFTDAKVSNLKTERLGKKPLAYQISKQVEGEYAVYTFEASSDVPQSLLTMIKLEQDLVLRYLITRVKEIKGAKVSKVSLRDSPQDSPQDSGQAGQAGQAKVTNVEETEEKPEVLEKKTVKVELKPKVALRDSVQAKAKKK